MSHRTSASPRLCLLALFITTLGMSVPGSAQSLPPEGIPYNGYLDRGGEPVNGVVRMLFQMYDQQTGGSLLWTAFPDVDVHNGAFSYVLGSGDPELPISVFSNDFVYLQVSVNDGSGFVPLGGREPLYLSAQKSRRLFFGKRTGQMLNLYDDEYAIGVQSHTLYLRSNGGFSWYRDGAHSDAQNNAGGGTRLMALSQAGMLSVVDIVASGDLSVAGEINGALNFQDQKGMILDLWNGEYGIGIQTDTQYFRSNSSFAWYQGGSHNDGALNPGGGTALMTLTSSGLSLPANSRIHFASEGAITSSSAATGIFFDFSEGELRLVDDGDIVLEPGSAGQVRAEGDATVEGDLDVGGDVRVGGDPPFKFNVYGLASNVDTDTGVSALEYACFVAGINFYGGDIDEYATTGDRGMLQVYTYVGAGDTWWIRADMRSQDTHENHNVQYICMKQELVECPYWFGQSGQGVAQGCKAP